MKNLKISVVIPTYNRDCIIDLLQCLFKQDYPDFEILVIDQSEILTPAKEEIIRTHSSLVKYYKIEERGRSLAKNYGITLATGDIILFCDDDIIVPANFLLTHANTYSNEKIGALSCRLVEEGQPAIPIRRPLRTTFYGRLINKPYSTKSDYVTSLNGGNMSFRKNVLDKIGFFEEFFIGTSMVEEPDMAFRMVNSGYKLFFNASITVYHYPQYNGNIAEFKKKRAEWFYYYFYNLCIFYMKYNRIGNMFFVFLYCVVLSLRHTFVSRLGVRSYLRMVSGYFHGTKRGIEIAKMHSGNKYYTPIRFEKKKYNPL